MMNTPLMPQSQMGHTSRRALAPQEAFPSLKLRLCVVQVLALTFFVLCPMWASLSLHALSAHQHVSQSCLPYNSLCTMPVSLPMLTILLVILMSLGFLADCQQSHVFRASISGVLARAPPLP